MQNVVIFAANLLLIFLNLAELANYEKQSFPNIQ